MALSQSVLHRAEQWAKWDPNETTANKLQDMLRRADPELKALFPDSRIGFGTAGLRSEMKIGPLGMNDLVVVQTAQGLAKYCLLQHSTSTPLVVIGYDHRARPELNISSLSFAILSATVFNQAGMKCVLLDGFVATPLVAFATTKLEAALGIMITASHNPKDDAGYKVYWRDGVQIRPPVDKGMALSILQNLEPWTDYRALMHQRRREFKDCCLGLSTQKDQLVMDYFAAIQACGLVSGQGQTEFVGREPPKFAYTAMHGVGTWFATRSFECFGIAPFQIVPTQSLPDHTFPTVVFPNPEEKGALDIAKAFAEENECDIVLANDPDADRLALAERDRESGEWTVFTGDQIGTMLGHWLWKTLGATSDKPVAMCASTVSSSMLAEIARVEGFHFEDTLTGFKWIGAKSSWLNNNGYRAIFGYEEAIGFCCGDVVFDKDGVSALGVIAELACCVYRRGHSMVQHMQSLYNTYGEFVCNNGYYFLTDGTVVLKILDDIRKGGSYVSRVGKYDVESIRDLGEPGYDSTTVDKKPRLPTSSSSPMMTLRFKNGCVAQFRASGTEPKFKYYIEMRGKPGVSRAEVTKELMVMSDVILEELLKPSENGLWIRSK